MTKEEFAQMLRDHLELRITPYAETGMVSIEVLFDSEQVASDFFYRDAPR